MICFHFSNRSFTVFVHAHKYATNIYISMSYFRILIYIINFFCGRIITFFGLKELVRNSLSYGHSSRLWPVNRFSVVKPSNWLWSLPS